MHSILKYAVDHEFVDSFINMDNDDLDHDHDTKSSKKQQIFKNVVHDHEQIIGGDQVPVLT